MIAAGQNWKTVWSWEGNNADGPIAGDDGTVLFANNDASNVMKLDPATGLATIVHADTNTGGALSRSKNGALFVASRGLNGGILQLEPQRKMFANSFNGEPIECVGGVLNDLVADARPRSGRSSLIFVPRIGLRDRQGGDRAGRTAGTSAGSPR